MIKRTFSTLASKLERDNKVVQYYKNIFVSHDMAHSMGNKYMATMMGVIGAGFFYINQDIKSLKSELKQDMKDLKTELNQDMKELKTELKDDMKELKSDIKDLKDLMIASNQQCK